MKRYLILHEGSSAGTGYLAVNGNRVQLDDRDVALEVADLLTTASHGLYSVEECEQQGTTHDRRGS